MPNIRRFLCRELPWRVRTDRGFTVILPVVVQRGRSAIEASAPPVLPGLSAPACRNADPALFFPAYGVPLSEPQITAAKELCATCPVREECLAIAVRSDESDGIWGGTTPLERRRMRLQLARMEQGTELARAVVSGEEPDVLQALRPAVVHSLLRMGWNAERIGAALKMSSGQVQTARGMAARAQAFLAFMERHCPKGRT
ncbi:WhiB family transcriptional regulator [Streptomyces sp. NPDC059761]|uniref:WhiB family transcriptional regulator n=1 Tax=Streptomyces sp. NPDC059761 TaxID=3346937 RepID=UPI0036463E73